MKLSFSVMNSLGNFLTVTIVAMIVLSHPVVALTETTHELGQIAVFNANSEPPPPVPENPWGSR